MPPKSKAKIIIKGITQDGKKFRPSDWAERVTGNLSTFKNHRIYYSPLLRPSYQDGSRCVIIDPKLQEVHPELFQQILDFARENRLTICEENNNHQDKKK